MKLKLTRKEHDLIASNNPLLHKKIITDYKIHRGLSEPTWLLSGPVYYVSEEIFIKAKQFLERKTQWEQEPISI